MKRISNKQVLGLMYWDKECCTKSKTVLPIFDIKNEEILHIWVYNGSPCDILHPNRNAIRDISPSTKTQWFRWTNKKVFIFLIRNTHANHNSYFDLFGFFGLCIWLVLKYFYEGFRFNSLLIMAAYTFFFFDRVFWWII
jgi:hypothetical protein